MSSIHATASRPTIPTINEPSHMSYNNNNSAHTSVKSRQKKNIIAAGLFSGVIVIAVVVVCIVQGPVWFSRLTNSTSSGGFKAEPIIPWYIKEKIVISETCNDTHAPYKDKIGYNDHFEGNLKNIVLNFTKSLGFFGFIPNGPWCNDRPIVVNMACFTFFPPIAPKDELAYCNPYCFDMYTACANFSRMLTSGVKFQVDGDADGLQQWDCAKSQMKDRGKCQNPPKKYILD